MLRIYLFLIAAIARVLAQDTPTPTIDDILDKHLTVPWRDDAIGHPDLVAFRDYLKKAAKDHNAQALLKVAVTNFRGCDIRGIDDLRTFLQGAWWSYIYRSLTEGGILSPDGKTFTSNYAVWTFPSQAVSIFGPESFRVVRGVKVPIFSGPDPHSHILGSLSYNLVVPEDPVVETGWQRVRFRRGPSGFIDSKFLIDPIGMSVRMRRIGAKWRLAAIATYCD